MLTLWRLVLSGYCTRWQNLHPFLSYSFLLFSLSPLLQLASSSSLRILVVATSATTESDVRVPWAGVSPGCCPMRESHTAVSLCSSTFLIENWPLWLGPAAALDPVHPSPPGLLCFGLLVCLCSVAWLVYVADRFPLECESGGCSSEAAASGVDTVTLEGGPSAVFVTVSFPDGPVEPIPLCGVTAIVRLL